MIKGNCIFEEIKYNIMKIDADVKTITKLKDYFFLVPDYQREYVWKPDDEVEQFLNDIENEYVPNNQEQRNYFIGSIIIVGNKDKYDVVDGQQRLTTIMLSLCVFRDILKSAILNPKQQKYFQNVEELLYDFDIESDETRMRLELQYEESHDFLLKLIQNQEYIGESTPSIKKMKSAYDRIFERFKQYLVNDVDDLIDFIKYFLTKIELVVIESQDLSSALKIFETINQRGAGLNAMDLVKNLLFSHTKENDFSKIKEIWKEITRNLQECGEDQNPLRFLRYFLMSRYYNGILREDDIYKWIISPEGKNITHYETCPVELAKEFKTISKRYSELVKATELMADNSLYPNITNIGFINKYKSRQHLILLLALHINCNIEVIEYLGKQIETFFFYSSTLRIQAKNNEFLFVQWAEKLRGVNTIQDVASIVDNTMLPYLLEKVGQFKIEFSTLSEWVYNPQYRLRYVLGKIENMILQKINAPLHSHGFYHDFQIEHILPQTPKDELLPDEFKDNDEYYSYVYRLGNITLLESIINQAINNCNNLSNDECFKKKQKEYDNSALYLVKLLNDTFEIGVNTALNRFKNDSSYIFVNWNKSSIENRQQILLDLVFDTWRINDKRLDRI